MISYKTLKNRSIKQIQTSSICTSIFKTIPEKEIHKFPESVQKAWKLGQINPDSPDKQRQTSSACISIFHNITKDDILNYPDSVNTGWAIGQDLFQLSGKLNIERQGQ